MADIHILAGNQLSGGIFSYRVIYHIPITEPIQDVVFPNATSELTDISTAELDAIKGGTLVEIVKSEKYNSNVSVAEQSQRLKDTWIKIRDNKNLIYPLEYKFFGVTLDVAD